MQFAYLDESYEPGDAYWLGVCLVSAARAPDLRTGIAAAAAVVANAEPLFIAQDVELHASQLFGGGGAFAPVKNAPPLRIAGFRAGVQAMKDAGARTILVGVQWSPRPPRSPVRFHRMEAVRRLFPILEADLASSSEDALIIADEEEGTTRDVFRELQAHQETMRPQGGSCVHDVVFVDSRFSPGVQGADLITFLHRRRSRPGNDPRSQVALDGIWALIQDSTAVHVHPAPPITEP
ncbi:unannotated protein [freshwater metagenome]|uniref:Unannotated protein n=1 Tax=freshwater metagenome TaxID=449393 RepID=A0A6J7FW57_9ZZZZ|nr:hypothetical protein [Actinomycetota bacterium]